MRAFQKGIGLLCCEQLLSNDDLANIADFALNFTASAMAVRTVHAVNRLAMAIEATDEVFIGKTW